MELSMEQKEYYMGLAEELRQLTGFVLWLEGMHKHIDDLSNEQQELFYKLLDKADNRLKELGSDLYEKRIEFGEISDECV